MDEIPNVKDWKTEFFKPEAREVVEAVGAWIYCFRKPTYGNIDENVEEALKAMQEVSEEHAGYAEDALMLAVAVPGSKKEELASTEEEEKRHAEWEDVCLQYGFEYIDYAGQGTNEFLEKTGFERLKEALEANEWAATTTADSSDELDALSLDGEGGDFERDEAEMTAELFGMKAALAGADDLEPEAENFVSPNQQAGQVDDLDRMMGRLLAVKEQSAGLPEAERKRMAAKAVKELMKENPEV